MRADGIVTTLFVMYVATSKASIPHTACPATSTGQHEGNLMVRSKMNCTWSIPTTGTDATFVVMVMANIASNQNIDRCTEASSEYATLPRGERICSTQKNLCKIYHSPRVVPRTNYSLFDANELGLCHVAWLPASTWPPSIKVVIQTEHFKVNITYRLVPVSVLVVPESTTRDQGKQGSFATLATSKQSETATSVATSGMPSTIEDAQRSTAAANTQRTGGAPATTGGTGATRNTGHTAALAISETLSVLSEAQTASTNLLAATRNAAATSESQHTTTTSTTTTADGSPLLEGSLIWIILISLSLTCIATATVINLVYQRRRRKRQRSNNNGDINPYAVSLRDGENGTTNYSNVQVPERPYDVIDLDGNKQRKNKAAQPEGPYLQPIPATGDRQYCEIGLQDTSQQAGPSTSFGRRNFFLYDVASDVQKRRGTYDKAEDTPPPLPTKAPQAQAPVGSYTEIVAVRKMDTDTVEYSLIVPSPDEEPCTSGDVKGSPVFHLPEPNNNDALPTADGTPGHSPYGEIIGTINEEDGALNRFKKVEDNYKEVHKKSAET